MVPDKTRLQDLDEAVRKFLAWESILKEKEKLDLSPHQVKQAEIQREAADGAVTARFPETCQWLVVPTQKKPQAPIREMNTDNARKLPDDVPVEFIRKRWDKLVLAEGGLDRRYYGLCALSELKNALRSGDIWVEGSRQFKNFNEYLLPACKFTALQQADELPLAVDTDCERYLERRLALLEEQLGIVDRLAQANELPDVILTD